MGGQESVSAQLEERKEPPSAAEPVTSLALQLKEEGAVGGTERAIAKWASRTLISHVLWFKQDLPASPLQQGGPLRPHGQGEAVMVPPSFKRLGNSPPH